MIDIESGVEKERREHKMGLTGQRKWVAFRTGGASLVEQWLYCSDLEQQDMVGGGGGGYLSLISEMQ